LIKDGAALLDNVNVLRVGFLAPEFSLPDTDGEIISPMGQLDESFLALCFFPPNPDEKVKRYLKDLNAGLPESASQMPMKVVAVSPARGIYLDRLKNEMKLDYPILSDHRFKVSRKYHLIDSTKFGTSIHFSIFVIDSDHIIRQRVSEYPGYSEYHPQGFRNMILGLL
jgi:peroxiredoxin